MDVIDLLEQTPNRVRALVEGRSEEDLSFKPSPNEFSLRENVLHLRDIDVEGYEVRILRILSERSASFPDIDGALLARLRAASPSDFQRIGELEGVRHFTLQGLLEHWIRHDREHLAEMTHLRNLLASA